MGDERSIVSGLQSASEGACGAAAAELAHASGRAVRARANGGGVTGILPARAHYAWRIGKADATQALAAPMTVAGGPTSRKSPNARVYFYRVDAGSWRSQRKVVFLER